MIDQITRSNIFPYLRKHLLKTCAIGCAILSLSAYTLFTLDSSSTPARAQTVNPWYADLNPQRRFFVSPTGGGDGSTPSSTITLLQAKNQAIAGDLYCLATGDYTGADGDYTFNPTASGTEEKPIVFMAQPGERPQMQGNISLGDSTALTEGMYNWIWGIDLTDPDGLVQASREGGSGIVMLAEGSRAINNIIHDLYDKNGIGSWGIEATESLPEGTLKNHVVYGNIVYDIGEGQDCDNVPRHDIYGHHSYRDDAGYIYGYRYYVNNVLLKPSDTCNKSFGISARSSGAKVSGMHFEKNIVESTELRVNGETWPMEKMTINDNYFLSSKLYAAGRPFQGEITNNLFLNSGIEMGSLWGVDSDPAAVGRDFTEITGNTYYRDGYDLTIIVDNIAYDPGNVALLDDTVIDYNTYSDFTKNNGNPDVFRGAIIAKDNTSRSTWDLDTWKGYIAEVRDGYPSKTVLGDEHSTTASIPQTNQVYIERNEYDPSIASLIVVNWEGTTGAYPVDISSVFATESVSVYPVQSYPGIASSSGSGTINATLSGDPYEIFIINSNETYTANPCYFEVSGIGGGGDTGGDDDTTGDDTTGDDTIGGGDDTTDPPLSGDNGAGDLGDGSGSTGSTTTGTNSNGSSLTLPYTGIFDSPAMICIVGFILIILGGVVHTHPEIFSDLLVSSPATIVVFRARQRSVLTVWNRVYRNILEYRRNGFEKRFK